jgi:hypothetical protein
MSQQCSRCGKFFDPWRCPSCHCDIGRVATHISTSRSLTLGLLFLVLAVDITVGLWARDAREGQARKLSAIICQVESVKTDVAVLVNRQPSAIDWTHVDTLAKEVHGLPRVWPDPIVAYIKEPVIDHAALSGLTLEVKGLRADISQLAKNPPKQVTVRTDTVTVEHYYFPVKWRRCGR